MKRHIFALLALTLCFLGTATAATIPPEIKKTVAFVFAKGSDGKLRPNGTAFFVSIPSHVDPKRVFNYLVTARHVLTVDGQNPSAPYLPEVYLRLNLPSGGSRFETIPIVTSGKGQTIFIPDDKSIDLAVIPVDMDPAEYEYKTIPIELITSTEDFAKLGIAEGSDIFFVGLLTQYIGIQRNYPVIRFGRVALLTPEKINFNGISTSLYLIESASYGGNSGSPVFYYLGSDRIPGSVFAGPPEIRLAGVMEATLLESSPIAMPQAASAPVALTKIGIAMVTPSYELRELLLSDALVRQRKQAGD